MATLVASDVRMDHVSVRVVDSGSPVILVPGLASPQAVWDGVVPALAKSHRLYLMHGNGFGGDEPGANLASGITASGVADIDALIVRERMRAPAVVGHSLGRPVALMLARCHLDHVGRVMVVDALPFFGAILSPDHRRAASSAGAGEARRGRRDGRRRSRSHRRRRGHGGTPGSHRGRKKVARWAAAADPRVTGQALFEDMNTDLRSMFSPGTGGSH